MTVRCSTSLRPMGALLSCESCSHIGSKSCPSVRCQESQSGTHLTKVFWAHPNLAKCKWLLCKKYWFSQVTILHMSRQLSCRDMHKIVAWLNYNNHNWNKQQVHLSALGKNTLTLQHYCQSSRQRHATDWQNYDIFNSRYLSTNQFTVKLDQHAVNFNYPDITVHRANVGPIWGRQEPGGPHDGPMNFAIWEGMGDTWQSVPVHPNPLLRSSNIRRVSMLHTILITYLQELRNRKCTIYIYMSLFTTISDEHI